MKEKLHNLSYPVHNFKIEERRRREQEEYEDWQQNWQQRQKEWDERLKQRRQREQQEQEEQQRRQERQRREEQEYEEYKRKSQQEYRKRRQQRESWSLNNSAKQAEYAQTLGVSMTATNEQIKQAYRRLILQYHPDRNHSDNAEEMSKRIDEAYENFNLTAL